MKVCVSLTLPSPDNSNPYKFKRSHYTVLKDVTSDAQRSGKKKEGSDKKEKHQSAIELWFPLLDETDKVHRVFSINFRLIQRRPGKNQVIDYLGASSLWKVRKACRVLVADNRALSSLCWKKREIKKSVWSRVKVKMRKESKILTKKREEIGEKMSTTQT